METLETLNAKLDALKAAAEAERQEVLAKLQEIRNSLPTGPATQADLDALGTRLDTEIARVQAIVSAGD